MRNSKQSRQTYKQKKALLKTYDAEKHNIAIKANVIQLSEKTNSTFDNTATEPESSTYNEAFVNTLMTLAVEQNQILKDLGSWAENDMVTPECFAGLADLYRKKVIVSNLWQQFRSTFNELADACEKITLPEKNNDYKSSWFGDLFDDEENSKERLLPKLTIEEQVVIESHHQFLLQLNKSIDRTNHGFEWQKHHGYPFLEIGHGTIKAMNVKIYGMLDFNSQDPDVTLFVTYGEKVLGHGRLQRLWKWPSDPNKPHPNLLFREGNDFYSDSAAQEDGLDPNSNSEKEMLFQIRIRYVNKAEEFKPYRDEIIHLLYQAGVEFAYQNGKVKIRVGNPSVEVGNIDSPAINAGFQRELRSQHDWIGDWTIDTKALDNVTVYLLGNEVSTTMKTLINSSDTRLLNPNLIRYPMFCGLPSIGQNEMFSIPELLQDCISYHLLKCRHEAYEVDSTEQLLTNNSERFTVSLKELWDKVKPTIISLQSNNIQAVASLLQMVFKYFPDTLVSLVENKFNNENEKGNELTIKQFLANLYRLPSIVKQSDKLNLFLGQSLYGELHCLRSYAILFIDKYLQATLMSEKNTNNSKDYSDLLKIYFDIFNKLAEFPSRYDRSFFSDSNSIATPEQFIQQLQGRDASAVCLAKAKLAFLKHFLLHPTAFVEAYQKGLDILNIDNTALEQKYNKFTYSQLDKETAQILSQDNNRPGQALSTEQRQQIRLRQKEYVAQISKHLGIMRCNAKRSAESSQDSESSTNTHTCH